MFHRSHPRTEDEWMRTNQQLHDLLNQEVETNREHERNLRIQNRQLLERERELIRKDTAIENLNSEIQNRENVIKKLRRDLNKAKNENIENHERIKQCESIIAELSDSVTKHKNRIHELYINKISYTPITMSLFRTSLEYIDGLLDSFIDHFN